MFTVKEYPSLSVEVVFMLLESERHHLSPDSSDSVDAVLTPACFSFGFFSTERRFPIICVKNIAKGLLKCSLCEGATVVVE